MTSTVILSDNGASSGSAGLKTTGGNDGVLILQTTTSGGTATNAIYVNDSQYVGFGTNYPTAKVTVNYNSSYAGTPANPTSGASIHLIAADNASAAFNMDTFGTPNSQITFRRSNGTLLSPSALTTDNIIGAVTWRGYGATGYSSGNRGLVQLLAAENWSDSAQGTYMQFNTVATGTTTSAESLRINGAGTVILKGGSTSATGVGIAFPATQSASTDANTLDDYEEGTFTPTVIGTTTAGTATYATRYGTYVKVGKSVTFTIGLQWSGHTGTGNMYITGLPFTANGSGGVASRTDALNMNANSYSMFSVEDGSTQILCAQTAVGTSNGVNIPVDAAAYIIINGTYITTA